MRITESKYQNNNYLPYIFLDIFMKEQEYNRFLNPNSDKMIDYEKFK